MGMKGKLMTNFVILAVGVLLVVFHKGNVLSTIITIMGVAFIVPSVVNLVLMLMRSKGEDGVRKTLRDRTMLAYGVVASLGGIGLGTWMVISPETLIGIVVYLFAAMMIIAGLYNVIMLAMGHRPVRFPLWMYVLPTLMVAAGVVILCTDVKSIESVVVLITGVSFAAFALNGFFEMYRLSAVKESESVDSEQVDTTTPTDDAHTVQ